MTIFDILGFILAMFMAGLMIVHIFSLVMSTWLKPYNQRKLYPLPDSDTEHEDYRPHAKFEDISKVD